MIALHHTTIINITSVSFYSDNYQQRHNIDQAKAVVRPGVYEEIRKQVDEMLAMNLKKIQMQIAPKSKKKSKKSKKKKAKKSKKDKKKKPLPGEKIAELKGLDSDQILSMLIENQLVVRGRQRKLESFIGDFNYLGSIHHNADRKDGELVMIEINNYCVYCCILSISFSITMMEGIANLTSSVV